jgi:hypothetical protein
VGADGSVTETVTVRRTVQRKTYRQKDWGAYNTSQHHEKEYVERLLRALCAGVVQPPRKPGPGRRPRLRSDLMFSAVMKNYLMLSGRRMRSDLEASAARGYLQHVGHENCVFNFLADPATTPLLSALVEQSAAPLGVIGGGAVRGRLDGVLDGGLRPLVLPEARSALLAERVGQAPRDGRDRHPRGDERGGDVAERRLAVA